MLEVEPRSRKDAQIGMSENIYTSAVVFSWKLYIARGTSIAATLVMGIVREVSVEQDRPRKGHVLATSIAWAVLSILLVPCLTRVDRRGFVITKVGREAERWIETDSATSAALADGQGPTLSPLPSRTKTLLYNAAL